MREFIKNHQICNTMKKYKTLYEIKDIGYNESSKLIRIIKDEKGKRFRIRIGVPIRTSNDIECHCWNGTEWGFVCGRYDITHTAINSYEQTPKKESLVMEAYDKIIKFIDCLED